MENVQQIGGAESEADAGNIFLGDFQSVEADDLAAVIEKRAAGVAGIDGGVGLDPGAGAEGRKFSNSADDAFSKGVCADGDAVEFDCCSWRRAG